MQFFFKAYHWPSGNTISLTPLIGPPSLSFPPYPSLPPFSFPPLPPPPNPQKNLYWLEHILENWNVCPSGKEKIPNYFPTIHVLTYKFACWEEGGGLDFWLCGSKDPMLLQFCLIKTEKVCVRSEVLVFFFSRGQPSWGRC